MERTLMDTVIRDHISVEERLALFLDKPPNKVFRRSIMMTFKSKEQIIKKRDKQIKNWAYQRLRYWSNMFVHNPKEIIGCDAAAYDEGYERGQESGILDAFYQIIEFLDNKK